MVGACNEGEIVPAVERYVREKSGTHFPQSRALIEMVGWIDDPAAVQLLAWVAERCKTRGLRNVAQAALAERAQRAGESVDALADAGIPTAGLDADGTLLLDAGSRRFLARLGDDLELALFDTEGGRLRSFPKPRSADDAEGLARAKATFAAAKKSVRHGVRAQHDRLREALLAERSWALSEWQRLLRAHPIVGRLVERLLWCEAGGAPAARSFRCAPDGSLVDATGTIVELEAGARIRLVHATLLSAAARTRWLRALEGLPGAPLFPQLRTLPLPLSEAGPELREIADFAERPVDGRKLLGATGALGWARGEAQDGAYYFVFRRAVTELGLVAELAFSGQGLFEPRPAVTLGALRFCQTGAAGRVDERGLPLRIADVPRIFLCEAWHEAAEIADSAV